MPEPILTLLILQSITDVLEDLSGSGVGCVNLEYDVKEIRIWNCSKERIGTSPLWNVQRE